VNQSPMVAITCSNQLLDKSPSLLSSQGCHALFSYAPLVF
jgi:hypothetical protein